MEKIILCLFTLTIALWFSPVVLGQSAGDRVRLESSNPKGVPVHPSTNDASFVRWANDPVVKVLAVNAQGKWFHISGDGKDGWVTKSYVTKIEEPDQDTEPVEAVAALVRYPDPSNPVPDDRLLAEAIKDKPELQHAFQGVPIKVKHDAKNVVLLVCSPDGKYAWLEDASWTLGVDHKWYLSKPPLSAEFTMDPAQRNDP